LIQKNFDIKNKFKEIINKFDNPNLIDICSGSGEFLNYFENEIKHIKDITCIDIIDKKITNENFKAKFIKMNSEKINFQDENFDIVTLSNSLHHIENLDKSLFEIKRIMKSKGVFIINEMCSDNLNNSQITHKILHHLAGEIDSSNNIFHRKTFKREEIIDIIKKEFKIIEINDYHIESNMSKKEFKYSESIY
jgi:ubiquinone/menaquinone biosynthesis C-methylase UbiE